MEEKIRSFTNVLGQIFLRDPSQQGASKDDYSVGESTKVIDITDKISETEEWREFSS